MALRTRPKMKLNLDQSLPNEECPGKPGSGGGNGGASAKGFSKPALETTSPFATFSKVVYVGPIPINQLIDVVIPQEN